ncbi:MAG TPA: PAS domain S-box protein [Dehalococcoidia bacterium]|nr:PAS domain S-box protein [Dehalococcoidia bacterium]
MKKQSRDSNGAGEEPMSGTILVVEDDQGLSRLIQGRLERLNFHVERALNGAQAIEWLASNRAALALLDYGLPDMTGAELIKALAENKCSVPFIVVTGRGDEVLAVEMMKLGARDYMVKDSTFLDRLPIAVQRTFEQLATEQKLAEAVEELKASEEKLRVMFESITDGIVVTDLQGKITDANDVVVNMSGLGREEIIGRDGFSLLPREDRDKVVGQGKKIVRGETGPVRMEHEVSPNVGSSSTTNLIIGTMHDSDGNPTGFVAIAQDFTERKRAEEELKESEKRFEDIALSSADLIWEVDANGKYVFTSGRVKQILGYSPEELIGKTPFELMPEEEAKHIGQIFEQIVAKKEMIVDLENWNLTKNGELVYLLTSGVPLLDNTGSLIGYRGVDKDITERKRAEEERERLLHDLERSNAELEQFGYIISHDLQEPLRMVASYTQLLEKRYKGSLDADAEEFIAYAVDGSKRMQNMIQSLLSYSRVGTRGKPFEPTECESVFKQALDNLKVTIDESGAGVTHDPLPRVMADETQMIQLFQNLLGNAIKFRGEEQPRIHVSAKQDSNECLFSVGDNGIGINPEYFDRIFVIFQRLHGREEYPGTGIGLSVCKRIVERHGGRIWVESQPGEGSTFHFTIPKGGEEQ